MSKKISGISGFLLLVFICSPVFAVPQGNVDIAIPKHFRPGTKAPLGKRNVYCYANADKNKACANQRTHNREWNSLKAHINEDAAPAENSQFSLPIET